MHRLPRSARAVVLSVLLPAWLLSLLGPTGSSALADTSDVAVGDLSVVLHAGTCSSPDRVPVFELTDPAPASGAEDDEEGLAASYSELSVPLSDLLAAPHALVAISPEGEVVACGEVAGETSGGGSLIVGMAEIGGSDVSGIAFFAPTAAGTAVSLFVGEGLVDDEADEEDQVGQDGDEGADDGDGDEDSNDDGADEDDGSEEEGEDDLDEDGGDDESDDDLGDLTAGLYEGTCDALGDEPIVAFSLPGEGDTGGVSVTTLPLSADQLGSGDYAIVIGFGDVEASCGEITGAALPGGDLLVGLREGDSDLSGFALLSPSGVETVVTLFLAEDLSEGDHEEAESKEDDEAGSEDAGDDDHAGQDVGEVDGPENEVGDQDETDQGEDGSEFDHQDDEGEEEAHEEVESDDDSDDHGVDESDDDHDDDHDDHDDDDDDDDDDDESDDD